MGTVSHRLIHEDEYGDEVWAKVEESMDSAASEGFSYQNHSVTVRDRGNGQHSTLVVVVMVREDF